MDSEPLEIAILSEGVSDVAVLKRIIWALTPEGTEEPFIRPVFPLPQQGYRSDEMSHGGWENLFGYLRTEGIVPALQRADLVIVHIDTDVAERPGFDIPHHIVHGDEAALDEAVRAKLRDLCGPEVVDQNSDRICFAIAIHQIECWLLGHWRAGKNPKITGCTKALSRELPRHGLPPVSDERGKNKQTAAYERASDPLSDPEVLAAAATMSPSLQRFIDCLAPKLQAAAGDS